MGKREKKNRNGSVTLCSCDRKKKTLFKTKIIKGKLVGKYLLGWIFQKLQVFLRKSNCC
jgi:hypothetical protein